MPPNLNSTFASTLGSKKPPSIRLSERGVSPKRQQRQERTTATDVKFTKVDETDEKTVKDSHSDTFDAETVSNPKSTARLEATAKNEKVRD